MDIALEISSNTALISTDALAQEITHLKIIDASWHMPSEKRDAGAEFHAAHIPGAVFFNIDAVCDRTSPYPHMLPTAEQFASAVGGLGISNADEVVVYDSSGIFSAPRLWWMFRVFGHDKVKVLDGGLPKWKAEGREVESGIWKGNPKIFHATFRPALVRTKEQVKGNIASRQELVLDARSPGRFSGAEPEPRPGLKSGHIEGSVNLFFKDVLRPPYHTMKTRQELHQLFAEKGIRPWQKLAATCGSGVTACILALALYDSNSNVAIYDGAWAEWGSQ